MKRFSISAVFFALTLIFPLANVLAESESEPTVSPKARPSHKSLQDKFAKQQKETAKKTTTTPVPKKEAVETTKNYNLTENSTLLASSGYWTPIPKGSVIYTPSHLKSKIVSQAKGKIVDWKQFLRKNQGWIHIRPVTMKEARGASALKPEAIKAYQSMGKMVIATYQKSPISVMPKALVIPEKK